ncbi:MAG: 2-hydroxyglutaryl-CoA dehydratase [Phycisphaeraceae bacterium]|nr:2-hydroxyglutaryl-CoA dehydratase [Phycisphaeraceae bacterium]
MIVAGIDAGSRAVKVVLLSTDNGTEPGVLASDLEDSSPDQAAHAQRVLDRVLQEAGHTMQDVGFVVATGYARHLLDFADKAITEITCHARGVQKHLPNTRSIIEIGGQDSKVIHLDAQGRVEDFTMNDRCAAGTGCFLELVARRLGVNLNELGELAEGSKQPATISSMCAVFAETEIIGLLAGGQAPCDIAAGVQLAIARRIASMAGRRLTCPVVFTGGVARTRGMRRVLSEAIDHPLALSPEPQLTGALGAALLAADHARSTTI